MDETVKYIIEQSDSEEEKTLAELVTSMSTFTQLGQYYGVLSAGTNLLSLLDYKFANISPEGVTYSAIDLTWFRIEFNSDPYLIYDDGTDVQKVTSNNYSNLISGWIVYVNNEPIIVKSDFNYFEINDEAISITSVTVPADSNVTIDYVCKIGQIEKDRNDVEYTKLTYYDTIGQLWGAFEADDSLITKIKEKYIVSSSNHIRQVSSIYGVSIEADPGTIVYVQDSFDDTVYKHVIGETGTLILDDEDTTIEELYFEGVEIDDSITIDEMDAVLDDSEEEPVIEGLYVDDDIDSTSIAIVVMESGEEIYITGIEDLSKRPVNAIVDYYCEVMEGDF